MFRKALAQLSTLRRTIEVKENQAIKLKLSDHLTSVKNIQKMLHEHKVNLTKVETIRSSKISNGQQTFFKLSSEKADQKSIDIDFSERKQQYNLKLQTSVPWQPKNEEELNTIGTMMDVKDELKDHPQFSDKMYRQRREYIAEISKSHKIGQSIPLIDYTAQEQQTWIKIYKILREKCNNVMSKRFLRNLSAIEQELGFKYRIPQLHHVDQYLQQKTGFRLKATSGILETREFLNVLAHKVFPCTQYIRHHEKPLFSPEPDIVHELIGHLPMLADQEVADLSQEIGKLSCGCENDDLASLGSLYWFTLEYGACKENGQIKGYGAGIASSIGECDNFPTARFEKFDPFLHSRKYYPTQTYQPTYLYTESFEEAFGQLRSFGETLQKPFTVYYDATTKELRLE